MLKIEFKKTFFCLVFTLSGKNLTSVELLNFYPITTFSLFKFEKLSVS